MDTVRQFLVAVAACIDGKPFAAVALATCTVAFPRFRRVAYWLVVPESDFGRRLQASLLAQHQRRSHFQMLVPGHSGKP